MKKNQLIANNRNLGIQILRFLLCLWVVFIHCSNIKRQHVKIFRKGFHVPSFFMLAFYFFYPILNGRKINKIIERFQRLLVPYILWPAIIKILNVFFNNIFSYKRKKIDFSLRYAFLQILLAFPYHAILWFQFNLIFLSLFLSIVCFSSKKNFLLIIQFILIISLFLQISRINYNFFSSYPGIMGKNLGCLLELLPLAITGCSIRALNTMEKFKNISNYSKSFLFSLIILLFKYDIFLVHKGFRYPNVFLNILSSTLFLMFFTSLSLGKGKIKNVIIFYITNFTGGIYYIHPIIKYFLSNSLFYSKINGTYISSFIIYFICYSLCKIGYTITNHNILKYLFI